MSKIVVVTTSEQCPAISALRSENIPFETVIVKDDYTYGQTLHSLWDAGEEFVSIEHDIVPWPGAIKAFTACYHCPYGWCLYQNMIGHSGKLQSALGLVRFSKVLMQEQPDANFGWDTTPWNHLDAQVFGALQVDRGLEPHIHTPPVAHLTDMKELKVYGATKDMDTDEWVMPWSNPELDVIKDIQEAIDKGFDQGLRLEEQLEAMRRERDWWIGEARSWGSEAGND